MRSNHLIMNMNHGYIEYAGPHHVDSHFRFSMRFTCGLCMIHDPPVFPYSHYELHLPQRPPGPSQLTPPDEHSDAFIIAALPPATFQAIHFLRAPKTSLSRLAGEYSMDETMQKSYCVPASVWTQGGGAVRTAARMLPWFWVYRLGLRFRV